MRLPLAATASLLAASAGPAHVDDGFDLSPRVVPGQRVEVASESSFIGEIEDLSVSVNDVEKLKAAMKEPEKYRDLKIRIGGWEAFFVDLPAVYQE